jgi:hypothetical protein
LLPWSAVTPAGGVGAVAAGQQGPEEGRGLASSQEGHGPDVNNNNNISDDKSISNN